MYFLIEFTVNGRKSAGASKRPRGSRTTVGPYNALRPILEKKKQKKKAKKKFHYFTRFRNRPRRAFGVSRAYNTVRLDRRTPRPEYPVPGPWIDTTTQSYTSRAHRIRLFFFFFLALFFISVVFFFFLYFTGHVRNGDGRTARPLYGNRRRIVVAETYPSLR